MSCGCNSSGDSKHSCATKSATGCKNGCAGVGNVAPSKVTEKYKSNKYYEVNYCYGEGESL
jgi:hypothetical protein